MKAVATTVAQLQAAGAAAALALRQRVVPTTLDAGDLQWLLREQGIGLNQRPGPWPLLAVASLQENRSEHV